MGLLNKLTFTSLKLNKKRSIVTIIGIILSVALITAVASMVVSFKASLINYQISNNGNYHYGFYNVPKSDLTYFEKNRDIESYYMTTNFGYAKIDESTNESKPYCFIIGMNDDSLNNSGIKLIDGRMPKSDSEIVIPRHLKTNGRVEYKVGDILKLNIGNRIGGGYELLQSNPYTSEESLEVNETKEYKVVGIVERPSRVIEPYDAPGYTFITYIGDNINEDYYNVYTRYNKSGLKNKYSVTAGILGVDAEIFRKGYESQNEYDVNNYNSEIASNAKYRHVENSYLISLETMSVSDDGTMRSILTIAGIVIFIIICTSVFCIRNSFNISITEKIKQYGMLASIGATSKQIKKNVFYEAFLLGIVGIPLGVASGIFASFVLILVTNYFLKEGLMDQVLSFQISILSVIVSILLSSVTIYLSARKSAKRASKTSPMVAIRSNDDIKIKSKRVKSPKIVKKIFGVGGDVSYKNLKRNRGKYRTTVISIVVCVSVYVALSYFVNMAFKVVKMEYGEYTHNLEVYMYDGNTTEKIQDVLKLDGIEKYCLQREAYFDAENVKSTKERVNYENVEQINEHELIYIASLGKDEYNRYLKELNMNSDEAKDKAILINSVVNSAYVNGKNVKVSYDLIDYNVGDKLTGNIVNDFDEDYEGDNSGMYCELQIAKITDKRPMGLERMNYGVYLIVSDEYMDKISQREHISLFIVTQNADMLQDEIDKVLGSEGYYVNNIDANTKSMNSLYTLIAIFLYGFIVVIALIGVTNIFNTITTNMELRSREFATLKSIGMTNKEFNKMIFLESFFYGVKSLIIGLPIGILLSYLIYSALKGEMVFGYVLPYKGIIVSVVVVFVLIFCIMRYSICKIRRKNIIETIRNENI